MDFYARLLALLKARGFKNIPAFCRVHSQFSVSSLYDYRDGKMPKDDRLEEFARLLQFSQAVWRYGTDEEFLAELEHDPTVPDPGPADEPSREKEHSSGIERSVDVVGHVTANGVVRGPIAIDSIPLPVPSGLLQKQHAKLHAPDEAAETRSVEAVPIDCQILIADEAIELRDQGETIYPGHYLIVTTKRDARAGKLVLARRVVDMDEFRRPASKTSLPTKPETKLFRYLPDDDGDWRLKPIDGSKKSFGSGDWEIVASVLWWRPP